MEDVYSSLDLILKNNSYLELGKKAKEFSKNFDWKLIVKEYLKIIWYKETMTDKFNGIIYLIIFVIHFGAYAVYAFRCLFTTKAFVDQYGMGDGAAIMTRFFGSIFVGSVLMAIYVGFIRAGGLENTWAFLI